MNFESLPNELLLNLFEYQSSTDLLRTFYNLNFRFNHLIFIHFQSFSLDFRSISKNDFNLICHQYLPNIVNHITSLHLSNNDDTPQEIDLFYQYGLTIRQFNHLKSLSLYELCSNTIMNKIILEWRYLSNLTHLTLAGCYLQFNQNNAQQLIDSIWNLPKLIYCYLNINFGDINIFIPTITSLSLKYLFIWGIEHNQNEINALLKKTPYLEYFSVLLNMDSVNNIEYSNSLITKLKLCLSQIEEDMMIKFMKNISNLSEIIIDLCSLDTNNINGFLNGYQWENIIRNYLPNLKKFQFKMEFCLNNENNREEQINNLINSFNNSFWINEHNWFIQCHWNSIDSSSSIYLYTLPYIFNYFHFDCSMKYKSTYPNDNNKNYFHYNHVHSLKYIMSSHEEINSSSIQFLNLNHLLIELPFNNNFWNIVPKLDRITSLEILTNNDNNIQLQLQNLINHMPHLYSISLSSLKLFTSPMLLFDLINTSIRQLDLRGYSQYFNDEQCTKLSHSLLGIQCEILFIYVENRHILLNLINNMVNLRTLNIECKDDPFDETKEDKLIIWVKEHLPSTCVISRDTTFHCSIQIWIR